jgi:hypothetical protein
MFFNKTLFLDNLKKSPLFEHTFSDLKGASDFGRRARAKEILTYFEDIVQGPDGHARTEWRVPSQNERGLDYKVTVAIIVPKLTLFGVAKRKWDSTKFPGILRGADVKVHCTCPDFLWGGIKHNLGVGKFKGALELKPSGYRGEQTIAEPPDETDPGREHILCKHCIGVADHFLANSFNIMKAAKDFIMEVEPNDEMTKGQKTPLKKDINLVDVDKETTSKFTEGIIHGAEEVEKELEKDTLTPDETEDVVDTVVEKEEPEIELEKEGTPEEILETKPVEEITEVPESEKVDSDLNPSENVPELDKDKETTEIEVEEEVGSVLDRSEEENKLEKDKLVEEV